MINEDKIYNIKTDMLQNNGTTNYLTHNFHIYPAKFIPQIPRCTIESLTNPKEIVLDPFCGCGTTLVEAKLLDRNSIGVDLNPISTVISKAKTNVLTTNQITSISPILNNIEKDILDQYGNKNELIVKPDAPNIPNISHWFQTNVINELTIIKKHLDEIKDESLRNYLLCAFSSIIVTVSNQESDTRYAARDKNIKNLQTYQEFKRKIETMNPRMLKFSEMATDSTVEVFYANSQNLDFIEEDSIDHIVTSPPYANTYDYYLYHKFRIYWLGYNIKQLQDNEIGSRNRHSSKKEDISTFIKELDLCVAEMNRVLKDNKYMAIVIGDSVIRKEIIRADQLMINICKNNNFRFIRKISYNLKMTSRMFNPKFINKDKEEHIMFFKNIK